MVVLHHGGVSDRKHGENNKEAQQYIKFKTRKLFLLNGAKHHSLNIQTRLHTHWIAAAVACFPSCFHLSVRVGFFLFDYSFYRKCSLFVYFFSSFNLRFFFSHCSHRFHRLKKFEISFFGEIITRYFQLWVSWWRTMSRAPFSNWSQPYCSLKICSFLLFSANETCKKWDDTSVIC